MRKIKKSILVLTLILSLIPVSAFASTKDKVMADVCSLSLTGEAHHDVGDVAHYAAIRYIKDMFPNNSKWIYGGQCYGYAVKINSLLGKESKVLDFNGLRATASNLKKKLMGVAPGTHVRFSNGKTFNGGRGHSVVILSTTDNGVYWTDNNGYKGYNRIGYYKSSWEKFGYRFAYLNRVVEPTSPSKVGEMKTYAFLGRDGSANVSWLPVKGAKNYDVYKSEGSKENFVKIGTAKSVGYVDKSADAGNKVWYKVVANTTNGTVSGNQATVEEDVDDADEEVDVEIEIETAVR